MWVIYDTINKKMLFKSEYRTILTNNINYYNNPTTILVWVYGQDLSHVPTIMLENNPNKIGCRAPISMSTDGPSISNQFKN